MKVEKFLKISQHTKQHDRILNADLTHSHSFNVGIINEERCE